MIDEIIEKLKNTIKNKNIEIKRLKEKLQRMEYSRNWYLELYHKYDNQIHILKKELYLNYYELEYKAMNKDKSHTPKGVQTITGLTPGHAIHLFKTEDNLYHPDTFELITIKKVS